MADESLNLADHNEGLLRAVANGHVTEVRCYLDEGMSVDTCSPGDGNILTLAVRTNHFDIVKLLLDRGANPNGTRPGFMTPLHRAVKNGNHEQVIMLLNAGANPAIFNHDGETAGHKWVETLNSNLYRDPSARALGLSALQSFVDHGLPVEKRNMSGSTLFTHAMQHCRQVAVLDKLHRMGADIGVADNRGNQPVHMHSATIKYDEDIVAFLVSSGADINAQNWEGNTPLHLCDPGKPAEHILSLGGDVNTRNNYGNTPLMMLMQRFHQTDAIANTCQLFLDAGADPDSPNLHGDTPRAIAKRGNSNQAIALFGVYDAKKEMIKIYNVNKK